MLQVLFNVPIHYLTDYLPDLPLAVYVVVGAALVALGIALDRLRRQGNLFSILGYLLGVPIAGLGILKVIAVEKPEIPIYGYGTMLFLAFVFCTWLAVRLGRREGISKKRVQDLAVWIFISGVIGCRAVFMIQYHENYSSPLEFFKLWDGGLVFYGGPIGALIGYFIGYFLWFRADHISNWKVADLIAPCAALGLALGRVGCLLNGCCYGNVACESCPHISFPISAPAVETMVKRGYQTMAGFTLDTATADSLRRTNIVRSVEPGSQAELAGLKPGDEIVKVNGSEKIENYYDLEKVLLPPYWPRGETELRLTVMRRGTQGEIPINIGPFRPLSIGLNPTQIYETISMVLLLFFLLSYYPLKRYDGSVMVFFMLGYGVHRFLNEMLRTDTEPVAFNMTLSQNISIVVLIAALILGVIVWRRGPRPQAVPAV